MGVMENEDGKVKEDKGIEGFEHQGQCWGIFNG